MPWLLLIGLALLIGSPTSAPAQGVTAPTAPAAGVLRVPGGTAALLTVAGLDPARPRATALLDIIRVVHDTGEGIDAGVDTRRTALFAYLEGLAAFERARAALPDGASPAAAADKKLRPAVEEFADAIGASLERANDRYQLKPGDRERDELRRAGWRAGGFDVAGAVAAFNRGEVVALTLKSDSLPLPLPERVWSIKSATSSMRQARVLFMQTPERFSGTLVAAILGDRRAALVYYGLCAMDADTRAYLAATPSALGEIYSSARVGSLALYGRSLRVRSGVMAVPGGDAAKALWEDLAEARATEPEQFILNVLGRDGGRLALLYDALAQMDEDSRTFVLGAWMKDEELRRDRFRALYRASEAALAAWKPEDRPFSRPLYDAAHVLLLTPVGAGGVPARPASRPLWERAFASLDLPGPKGELRSDRGDAPMDAAAVVELVCVTNATARRERAEAWLFGHRVFKDARDTELEHVLVALRGHQRFRVLADTLERLGISDPAVYAAAMRRAQEIADVGDRPRQISALMAFQGTLVLIEHARLARSIDVAFSTDAVKTLSGLPFSDGEWNGGVARWIDEALLPALARPGGQDSAEHVVLRAFGGRGSLPSAATPRVVDVEGGAYQIDPSAPVFARLRSVREKQGGWSLDDVLVLARHVRALAAAPTAVQVAEHRKALAADLEALRAGAGSPPDLETGRLLEDLGDALEDLGEVRKDKDVKKARGVARKLEPRAEWCLARVLAAIAYAPVLGDDGSNELLAGDPSPRHDFGVAVADTTGRVRNPWLLPAETHEGTGKWHIVGALLAMDVGLSRQALRRISTDSLPPPPTIKANDRLALAEAVALANIYEYRDDDLQRLVAAVRRGRVRVTELSPSADVDAVMDLARVDPMRREQIAWSLAHDQASVSHFFSTGDLLEIGQDPAAPRFVPAAWGTSGWSVDGCLCLAYPPFRYAATLVGRYGKGLLAALVPDVTLLVAEAVADHGLPAELTLSVLAAATQDVIDALRPAHDDDWVGVIAQVQQLVPQRVDDYVAAVMTGGVLVSVPDAPDEQRH